MPSLVYVCVFMVPLSGLFSEHFKGSPQTSKPFTNSYFCITLGDVIYTWLTILTVYLAGWLGPATTVRVWVFFPE